MFALDDSSPNRIAFNLKRVMRTRYRIDDFQQSYFVIDSYEDLLKQTLTADFAPLYAELAEEQEIEPEAVLPTDSLYTRGTQEHVRR